MTLTRDLSTLGDVLASIYGQEPYVMRLVTNTGLNPSFIAFDERPLNTWYSILSEAERQGKLDDLLGLIIAERPEDERLKLLAQDLQSTSVPRPDLPATSSARRRHLNALAQELRRRYDTLTRRIAAIDIDIARALGSLDKQVLEERRQELAVERDHIITELGQIEKQLSD